MMFPQKKEDVIGDLEVPDEVLDLLFFIAKLSAPSDNLVFRVLWRHIFRLPHYFAQEIGTWKFSDTVRFVSGLSQLTIGPQMLIKQF